MVGPVRTIPWSRASVSAPDPLPAREWLVTNGLGGYASGTVSGAATRRYHGLLIAALPAPLGRLMVLNHLDERVRLADGTVAQLDGVERAGRLGISRGASLVEFRLEAGLPVWRFEIGDVVLEKRIVLLHSQNTTYVTYRLISGTGTVRLRLRPSLNMRPHDAPVD
ncbi:MAG: glycogen debranching enzyme N-terminal domain-containing protein, partial [Isosphaeraceae bacterium]